MLVNNNKIELHELKRLEEVGCTKDPKYYHNHKIISHPTKDCFILKDKIETPVKMGVLRLNKKRSK